jgi:pyruvate kinase
VKGWASDKRTKIVCTIGPASSSPEVLEALILQGMDVVRLNFSHGTREEHARVAKEVREISARVGRPVAILGDLSGPKIRVGVMKEGTTLATGSLVTLTPGDVVGDPWTVPVNHPGLARDVRVGDAILVADGTLELRVEAVEGQQVVSRVVVGGPLPSHKGVNVPTRTLSLPSLTPKDEEDLRFAVGNDFDYVAQSFVQSAEDVARAKAIAEEAGRALPVIAKVERQGALDRLEAILAAADGVMVARGDLGVETPLARVPAVQKRVIRLANELGKPVTTATQMLESMVESPRPTRAEATDVYNAILDGTDAVMLSEESAIGKHPVEAVKVLKAIALEAEAALARRVKLGGGAGRDVREAVGSVAVDLAGALNAVAIVTPTASGLTARTVARHRPPLPIVALTPDDRVLRRLALVWGVAPFPSPSPHDLDTLMNGARDLLRSEGLPTGSPVVMTMGYPPGKAHTNMVLVMEI